MKLESINVEATIERTKRLLSEDPNRDKKKKASNGRKPGGQKGHNGASLEKISDPDFIKDIPLDKASLPEGKYKEVGFVSRQVIDIYIFRE